MGDHKALFDRFNTAQFFVKHVDAACFVGNSTVFMGHAVSDKTYANFTLMLELCVEALDDWQMQQKYLEHFYYLLTDARSFFSWKLKHA